MSLLKPEYLTDNGGIYSLMPKRPSEQNPDDEPPEYISWNIEDSKIALDGDFSSNELREIADYMDKHKS